MTLRPIRLALALGSTALLAAACGGGAPGTGADNGIKGKAISAIESQVNQAVKDNKTFSASGAGNISGKAATITLQVNFPAKQLSGKIVITSGGSMTLVVVNNHVFATLDKAIAEAFGGGSAADALAGKCIDFGSSTDANNPLGGANGLGNFSNGDIFAGSTWTKGSVKTVNGIETLAVTSSDGTELDVATHGDALPVQLVSKTSSTDAAGSASNDTTTLTFTNWGGNVSISQPNNCQSLQALEQAILSGGGQPTDTSGAMPSDTPTPTY